MAMQNNKTQWWTCKIYKRY